MSSQSWIQSSTALPVVNLGKFNLGCCKDSESSCLKNLLDLSYVDPANQMDSQNLFMSQILLLTQEQRYWKPNLPSSSRLLPLSNCLHNLHNFYSHSIDQRVSRHLLIGTTLAIPILDNSQQFNFSTLQLQCTITIAIPQTSRTTIQLIHSTDLELDSVDKTEKQVYTTIFVLLWSNQHLYTSNYWKRVLTNRIQQENNRSKTLRQKSNMRWA